MWQKYIAFHIRCSTNISWMFREYRDSLNPQQVAEENWLNDRGVRKYVKTGIIY